jgi:glutamyl-tRNA reductase
VRKQIVAQIKDAARAARAAGTTGPAITGLIDAALRASKRARTQTTISTEGVSLAQAGLDLADAHLGGLTAREAVVFGTGSMGKLAARLLREAGVGRLSVASEVPAALAHTDILITATGPPFPSCPPSRCRLPGRTPPAGRCSCSTWGCRRTWTLAWGTWPGSP